MHKAEPDNPGPPVNDVQVKRVDIISPPSTWVQLFSYTAAKNEVTDNVHCEARDDLRLVQPDGGFALERPRARLSLRRFGYQVLEVLFVLVAD